MTCKKCGRCCRYMKLKIEGLNQQARAWIMSHKDIMMSGDYIIINNPCIHLMCNNQCAIYENRFSDCRLMIPGSKECDEAQTIESINNRQIEAIKNG